MRKKPPRLRPEAIRFHTQWVNGAATSQGQREDSALILALNDALDDALSALQELVTRCDGDEGVRADGSNIETIRAHVVLGGSWDEK